MVNMNFYSHLFRYIMNIKKDRLGLLSFVIKNVVIVLCSM
jgi:hypothetical protein